MDRPSTSKPRGTCLYYNDPRGCFAGRKCKFLHGESEHLTPYDSAKMCKYYNQGFCRRGDQCWFRHVVPERSTVEEDRESVCCICLENPTTYGLLTGCSHIFCLQCIRRWRDPKGKSGEVACSGVTKKCPLCRSPSKFIIPSSRFVPHNTPEKEVVVEKYKSSMARMPCRYFQKSKNSSPFCPFGKDCFYQHINDDGSLHVFPDGLSQSMKKQRTRRIIEPAWDNVHHYALTQDLESVFRATSLLSWRTGEGRINDDEDSDSDDSMDSLDIALEPSSRGDEESMDRLADQMLATLAALRAQEEALDRAEEDARSREIERMSEAINGPMNQQMVETEVSEVNTDGYDIEDSTAGDEEDWDGSGLWSFSYRPVNASHGIPFPIMTSHVDNPSSDWMAGSLNGWHFTDPSSSAPNDSTPLESNRGTDMTESASVTVTGSSAMCSDHLAAEDITIPADDEHVSKEFEHASGIGAENSGENTEREVASTGVGLEEQHAETPAEVDTVERQEPPFVTDGRGRVVWSSAREVGGGQATRGWSRGGKGRRSERVSGDVVGDSSGFTTDGRGKVIGTSQENLCGSGELTEREDGEGGDQAHSQQ